MRNMQMVLFVGLMALVAGCGGAEVDASEASVASRQENLEPLCTCEPARAVWRYTDSAGSVDMRIDANGDGRVVASTRACWKVGDFYVRKFFYQRNLADGTRLYSFEQQGSPTCPATPFTTTAVVAGAGPGSTLWGGSTVAGQGFRWNWVSW